jgi:hypothetical protein
MLECLLLTFFPFPFGGFMCELNERSGNRGIVFDEVSVIPSKTEEFPDFSNRGRGFPVFDFLDLRLFYMYFPGFDNNS